ncbi:MAG: lytic transglycosylase domain-containing protein [Rhizobiaceae bacterium]|nr:lytic transglycosylase domain-containing protein [Rhizobiaceae bacterium]
MLAACGGIAGCATSGDGAILADAAPTSTVEDVALPQEVALLPQANPAFSPSELAARSLAAEVEQNAALPSAYSGATVADQTATSAIGSTTQVSYASASAPVVLASANTNSNDEALARRMRPEAVHPPQGKLVQAGPVDARSPELEHLIKTYAEHYEVPVSLVRRVAKRESTLNPKARNGPYWGLMQISHATARGMGYRGEPSGLLDAETNLKYAVRYLRGALLVAKGDEATADRLYQRGYYYDAKRMGLLEATGLGRDRTRSRF